MQKYKIPNYKNISMRIYCDTCLDYHTSVVTYNCVEVKQSNVKVILCASEHICSIVRYCFRSFKQL